MGYFKKHWQGEQSLAVSYWVNAVLISAAMHVVGLVLTVIAPVSDPVALSRVVAFIAIITLLVISPWQFVGLWRCTRKCITSRGGAFWARLARAQIALGVLSTLSVTAYLWPLL